MRSKQVSVLQPSRGDWGLGVKCVCHDDLEWLLKLANGGLTSLPAAKGVC